MFEIHTTDRGRLRRIATAGAGGIIVGLLLVGLNLVVPFVSGAGIEQTNLVFGVFGLVVVMLATHPTYQAAVKLDEN